LAAGALALLTGCSAPASPPRAGPPAKEVPAASPVQSATVNLDEIFPRGRGRDLVLNNCTSCHTFVPIVVLQMTKDAWERNSRDHRGRVTSLSDADFKALYEYLIANFNPDRPVPKLPQELLNTWTGY
jgi:cytochrome c5